MHARAHRHGNLVSVPFFALKEGCICQNLEPLNLCFLIESHRRRAGINYELYRIGPSLCIIINYGSLQCHVTRKESVLLDSMEFIVLVR